MNFHDIESFDEQFELMNELSQCFLSRAHKVDIEGSFPYENIQDLKDTGYTALTVPKKFGGREISLYDMLRFQEKIAEGDGATALSIGWHMGIIKNLSEKNSWNENIFNKICEDVKNGSLINSAATEAGTGSPTRGGRPETTAIKDGNHWIINGRKTFTTMAPVLDYFIVSASITQSDQIGNFLIPRSSNGLLIEETWDSIALRGTGSHDLILKNVSIPEENFVEQVGREGKKTNGWLLHIPACYLGIAKAAQKYAINFALEYSPNSVEGTIIDLPNVRQKIGEMELKLMESEFFLHSVAKKWDDTDEQGRGEMGPFLGAAKLTVTNNAIKVVDLAMRLVGARSLSLKNPLQRYYRDVRAGLHNPPMDDMTIQLLAHTAIKDLQK
ncbi:alkylation response protein AidB-like acyl-CoA dehydrogenase [Neobacillus niacini]|uniref:acyl-CoA dehydrogenase family protein n=1 Tax=Neobacillus niacini TaxID=86668 RepID=UPI00286752EC|nr:acyl-CoA dehydrogenase family protein [Neobacillus niacini]MDR7075499.1 alkylation response protein AidB-like acyl-CoA dehydrogenase [Neobacillus niacini]